MKAFDAKGASVRLFFALALAGMTLPAVAQETKPDNATKPAVTSQEKDKVLAEVNEIIAKQAFVPGKDFSKWPEYLKTQKEAISTAKSPDEFALAINRALNNFGISHIVLATPRAAESRATKQNVGIGIQLQTEDEGLRVISVFPKSPAAEAGLEMGDLVVEGNGEKATDAGKLAGEEGTILKLKVKKVDGTTKDYEITRRKYSSVRPETLTWASPETAVLKVHTFDVGYSARNVEKLIGEAKSAKNLVLDLRSNPGGAVINLTHLMGLLLPDRSPLGTFISRRTVENYVEETKGSPSDLTKIAEWSPMKLRASTSKNASPFKGNIAVLVNGGSGSAAEIAAAALQETVGAPVIGEASAGAVLVSVMQRLPSGYMLQFPITDFVTVKGVRLEGTGVKPTIEAPSLVRFGQPDQCLEKAVQYFQSVKSGGGGGGK